MLISERKHIAALERFADIAADETVDTPAGRAVAFDDGPSAWADAIRSGDEFEASYFAQNDVAYYVGWADQNCPDDWYQLTPGMTPDDLVPPEWRQR